MTVEAVRIFDELARTSTVNRWNMRGSLGSFEERAFSKKAAIRRCAYLRDQPSARWQVALGAILIHLVVLGHISEQVIDPQGGEQASLLESP